MLSANAYYDYSKQVEDLPAKDRKAYRQRCRYWLSKGLPQTEAERRASLKTALHSLHRKEQTQTAESLPENESTKQKTCQPENLPTRKPAEPTNEEIDAVIQELRDRGQIMENPQMIGQTNVLAHPVSRKSAGQKTCRAENPARQLAEFLPIAGYLLIVAAASVLLISASLQVFGNSWQGWFKASLLEVGILLFAVSKAHGPTEWLTKRTSAAFLISLSLFVLHTGVETDRHEQLVRATLEDTGLQILQDRRARLILVHDSLPENHITRRTELLASLESLDSQITQQLEASKSSGSAQVINLSYWSETLMRSALLLISIVFSHALVREYRERVTTKEGIQTA